MAVCRIASAILSGLEVQSIGVEVDVRKGLPNFTVVGMAKDAVRESRDRVMAAVKNSGFKMPAMKITVNLTPVHIKKVSPLLDLPIAVGVLSASRQMPPPGDAVFLGELSLDGSVRMAPGILAILDGLRSSACVVVPESSLPEASLLAGVSRSEGRRSGRRPVIRGLAHVSALAAPLDQLPRPVRLRRLPASSDVASEIDFSEIRGQFLSRRAAEISAAGGHHLLLIGPPGSGKSMIARRIPTILPSMTAVESLEATKIHSIAGLWQESTFLPIRPFRSPHHTLSGAALVGGGPMSLPGEITLAHRGVLFLDEFPEFHRSCLEALRQPLEERCVTISRAAAKVTYPADFLMICAMNPCPCGYYRHPERACRCSASDVRKYFSKLSGPILNRIDLQVELSAESPAILLGGSPGESGCAIRRRVIAARNIQERRFDRPGQTNAGMTPSELRRHAPLSPESTAALTSAIRRIHLTPRSLEKVIKVARTIADLESAGGGEGRESVDIRPDHILEAVQFRAMDQLTSAIA